MSDKSTRLKRLLYQSWHRGCKETDQLLGNYARERLASMDDSTLALYESFLEESDWDIYAWLTGALPTPKQYDRFLIKDILAVNRSLAERF